MNYFNTHKFPEFRELSTVFLLPEKGPSKQLVPVIPLMSLIVQWAQKVWFTDKMSKSQTPKGQNVERQNVERQNAEWDKTSNGKNTEWDKTSNGTNVKRDKRPNGTKH